MSDIGLHESVYEQLRFYADHLDKSLIALRSPRPEVAEKARGEIVSLLKEITNKDSMNPTSRLVTAILKHSLPEIAGQGLSLCVSLKKTLEQRPPNLLEMNQLEMIALTLDKECSSTLARITGKR